MKISFDPEKRSLTLLHRNLDMARADEVFSGPTLTLQDERKDYGEDRFITVGYLAKRLVVLVWTERSHSRCIISMRKANDRERALYEPRLVRS